MLNVKRQKRAHKRHDQIKYKIAYNLEKIRKKVDTVLELARTTSKDEDIRKGVTAIDTVCNEMYGLMQFNPKYLQPQLKLTKVRKIFMDLLGKSLKT